MELLTLHDDVIVAVTDPMTISALCCFFCLCSRFARLANKPQFWARRGRLTFNKETKSRSDYMRLYYQVQSTEQHPDVWNDMLQYLTPDPWAIKLLAKAIPTLNRRVSIYIDSLFCSGGGRGFHTTRVCTNNPHIIGRLIDDVIKCYQKAGLIDFDWIHDGMERRKLIRTVALSKCKPEWSCVTTELMRQLTSLRAILRDVTKVSKTQKKLLLSQANYIFRSLIVDERYIYKDIAVLTEMIDLFHEKDLCIWAGQIAYFDPALPEMGEEILTNLNENFARTALEMMCS